MGNNFRPNNAAQNPIRTATIGASRAAAAPGYNARGQGIAAQKFVDAAKDAAAFKKKTMNGSGAFPPKFKEV